MKVARTAPESSEESVMVAGTKVVAGSEVVARSEVFAGPPIPLTTAPTESTASPLDGKRKRIRKKIKAGRRRKPAVWLKRVMCSFVSFFLNNFCTNYE